MLQIKMCTTLIFFWKPMSVDIRILFASDPRKFVCQTENFFSFIGSVVSQSEALFSMMISSSFLRILVDSAYILSKMSLFLDNFRFFISTFAALSFFSSMLFLSDDCVLYLQRLECRDHTYLVARKREVVLLLLG